MQATIKFFGFLFLFLSSTLLFSQTGNVKLGTGAGSSISSGDYNVMVGDSAATHLRTSSLNVIIGRRAGLNINYSSTFQANNNVFLGADAGYNTYTADDNVFIGYQAGFSNTSATDNVFIGFRAGYFNVARSDNTFIGNGAGFNNTEGDDNTFIGESAGSNVTTGDDNTFIGHKSGGAVSSISAFTGATSSGATGSDNTAVGSSALYRITSNFRNVAIGNDAGYDLSANASIPPTTVIAQNYGSYNTFVGDSTGVDVGRGAFNTFIGQAAGAATEAGSRNTFVGFRAGWDNNRTNHVDDAHENTYLGYRTGHTNREGSFNVLLGSRTDFKTVGSTKNNYNVAIGYNTEIGGSGFEGKDYVVMIGANTSVDADYAVAIGAGATTSTNNTMVLGGNTVTNRVTVGIGTNAPNIKSSLDLADTDKGFLVNRLTNAQKTILQGTLLPADIGVMVYDTDDKILYVWDGTQWTSSTTSDLETRVSNLETAAQALPADATPQKFNYQTSILDVNGEPIMNQAVNFRISIIKTSAIGITIYVETQSITTTSKGLTNFEIGNGTLVSGVFTDIDWSADTHFLKIEADVAGGIAYTDFGTTQLISVPYALHAKTADKLTGNLSGALARNGEVKKLTSEVINLKAEIKEMKEMFLKMQSKMSSKK